MDFDGAGLIARGAGNEATIIMFRQLHTGGAAEAEADRRRHHYSPKHRRSCLPGGVPWPQ
jgi:hypothetical protein